MGSLPKPLEPMEVNRMMTYGNFFTLGASTVSRIRLEISLPGRAAPVEADFAYEHGGAN